MILLTTPSQRAPECAAAIQQSTGQPVKTAASLQDALGLLREESYELIVFDQAVMEADPDQAELAIQHAGTAVVLDVNCAIAGGARIARETRTALRRRDKEVLAARQSAEKKLCSDLRQPLTALILESELTLKVPDLPAAAIEKLRAIHQLATTIGQLIAPQHAG